MKRRLDLMGSSRPPPLLLRPSEWYMIQVCEWSRSNIVKFSATAKELTGASVIRGQLYWRWGALVTLYQHNANIGCNCEILRHQGGQHQAFEGTCDVCLKSCSCKNRRVIWRSHWYRRTSLMTTSMKNPVNVMTIVAASRFRVSRSHWTPAPVAPDQWWRKEHKYIPRGCSEEVLAQT